jgi:chemotaxis protein histidine kinase CheA
MTLKGHLFSSTRIAGFRASPAELRAGRLMRAPDDHVEDDDTVTETDDEKAAREAKEAEEAAAAAEAAKNKTKTAEEAQAALEAANEELEALRAKVKEFDGIDAAQARENAKKVADAEKAAKEAAAAAKKAEKERAQAENNVEALRKIQQEEHDAAIAAVVAERDAARQEAQTVASQLTRVRTENAFNGSKFINDETILTGAKAQRLFGDYVEVEDGQVVVYDAPAGEAKRAKIMDSKGNPLPFNDAIKKVIEADPDKDSLLKSKTKPGAGTKTVDGKSQEQAKGDRLSRLSQGLAKLREQNAR